MAITERTITMPAQFAAAASTTIPSPPVPGVAYRDQNMSAAIITQGQRFGNIPDSSEWNQVQWLNTGMIQQAERYCAMPYSGLTDYPAGGRALGLDDERIYVAVQPSGPGNGGAQPTSNSDFWRREVSGNTATFQRIIVDATGTWTAPSNGYITVTMISEGQNGETVQGSSGGPSGISGSIRQKSAAVTAGDSLSINIGAGWAWTAGSISRTTVSGVITMQAYQYVASVAGVATGSAFNQMAILAYRPRTTVQRRVTPGGFPLPVMSDRGGVAPLPIFVAGVINASDVGGVPVEFPYAYGAGGNGGTVGSNSGVGEQGEQGCVIIDYFSYGE